MATTKTVKRVKLSSGKATKKKAEAEPAKASRKTSRNVPVRTVASGAGKPFIGVVRYIRGSWHELTEVRWPNRRATWGLTLAVLLFTAFFVVIILLLDSGFQYLFKEVLLK